MEVEIIEASTSDYIEVNRIVREGHEEHVEGDRSIFRSVETVMPEDYYNELLKNDNSKIFIAKLEEETVGFAIISLEVSPPFPSLVSRNYAYIHDFGVDQRKKRRSIGSKLFERCIQWSEEKNVTTVELNVWEFNKDALAFYEKQGMNAISRRMRIDIK
ncbi:MULTISPECIES: GNAT family N-acetyltransferase [Solibacillus]|uniref:GNAT family N-acetyltransferase n=1 Tax=Solibacillus merdavium TaxID=2762218 RepID=A0ABR8XS29_9BACL|nr:GNAT family N-acetyltransferase [Solibacillus merdavium]MBD8034744.1 GNAT family N-acetyltransferase [Solibacillus merdavium]